MPRMRMARGSRRRNEEPLGCGRGQEQED
jgi:hypothetical protein